MLILKLDLWKHTNCKGKSTYTPPLLSMCGVFVSRLYSECDYALCEVVNIKILTDLSLTVGHCSNHHFNSCWLINNLSEQYNNIVMLPYIAIAKNLPIILT